MDTELKTANFHERRSTEDEEESHQRIDGAVEGSEENGADETDIKLPLLNYNEEENYDRLRRRLDHSRFHAKRLAFLHELSDSRWDKIDECDSIDRLTHKLSKASSHHQNSIQSKTIETSADYADAVVERTSTANVQHFHNWHAYEEKRTDKSTSSSGDVLSDSSSSSSRKPVEGMVTRKQHRVRKTSDDGVIDTTTIVHRIADNVVPESSNSNATAPLAASTIERRERIVNHRKPILGDDRTKMVRIVHEHVRTFRVETIFRVEDEMELKAWLKSADQCDAMNVQNRSEVVAKPDGNLDESGVPFHGEADVEALTFNEKLPAKAVLRLGKSVELPLIASSSNVSSADAKKSLTPTPEHENGTTLTKAEATRTKVEEAVLIERCSDEHNAPTQEGRLSTTGVRPSASKLPRLSETMRKFSAESYAEPPFVKMDEDAERADEPSSLPQWRVKDQPMAEDCDRAPSFLVDLDERQRAASCLRGIVGRHSIDDSVEIHDRYARSSVPTTPAEDAPTVQTAFEYDSFEEKEDIYVKEDVMQPNVEFSSCPLTDEQKHGLKYILPPPSATPSAKRLRKTRDNRRKSMEELRRAALVAMAPLAVNTFASDKPPVTQGHCFEAKRVYFTRRTPEVVRIPLMLLMDRGATVAYHRWKPQPPSNATTFDEAERLLESAEKCLLLRKVPANDLEDEPETHGLEDVENGEDSTTLPILQQRRQILCAINEERQFDAVAARRSDAIISAHRQQLADIADETAEPSRWPPPPVWDISRWPPTARIHELRLDGDELSRAPLSALQQIGLHALRAAIGTTDDNAERAAAAPRSVAALLAVPRLRLSKNHRRKTTQVVSENVKEALRHLHSQEVATSGVGASRLCRSLSIGGAVDYNLRNERLLMRSVELPLIYLPSVVVGNLNRVPVEEEAGHTNLENIGREKSVQVKDDLVDVRFKSAHNTEPSQLFSEEKNEKLSGGRRVVSQCALQKQSCALSFKSDEKSDNADDGSEPHAIVHHQQHPVSERYYNEDRTAPNLNLSSTIQISPFAADFSVPSQRLGMDHPEVYYYNDCEKPTSNGNSPMLSRERQKDPADYWYDVAEEEEEIPTLFRNPHHYEDASVLSVPAPLVDRPLFRRQSYHSVASLASIAEEEAESEAEEQLFLPPTQPSVNFSISQGSALSLNPSDVMIMHWTELEPEMQWEPLSIDEFRRYYLMARNAEKRQEEIEFFSGEEELNTLENMLKEADKPSAVEAAPLDSKPTTSNAPPLNHLALVNEDENISHTPSVKPNVNPLRSDEKAENNDNEALRRDADALQNLKTPLEAPKMEDEHFEYSETPNEKHSESATRENTLKIGRKIMREDQMDRNALSNYYNHHRLHQHSNDHNGSGPSTADRITEDECNQAPLAFEATNRCVGEADEAEAFNRENAFDKNSSGKIPDSYNYQLTPEELKRVEDTEEEILMRVIRDEDYAEQLHHLEMEMLVDDTAIKPAKFASLMTDEEHAVALREADEADRRRRSEKNVARQHQTELKQRDKLQHHNNVYESSSSDDAEHALRRSRHPMIIAEHVLGEAATSEDDSSDDSTPAARRVMDVDGGSIVVPEIVEDEIGNSIGRQELGISEENLSKKIYDLDDLEEERMLDAGINEEEEESEAGNKTKGDLSKNGKLEIPADEEVKRRAKEEEKTEELNLTSVLTVKQQSNEPTESKEEREKSESLTQNAPTEENRHFSSVIAKNELLKRQ